MESRSAARRQLHHTRTVHYDRKHLHSLIHLHANVPPHPPPHALALHRLDRLRRPTKTPVQTPRQGPFYSSPPRLPPPSLPTLSPQHSQSPPFKFLRRNCPPTPRRKNNLPRPTGVQRADTSEICVGCEDS